jgi:hypothetical protein
MRVIAPIDSRGACVEPLQTRVLRLQPPRNFATALVGIDHAAFKATSSVKTAIVSPRVPSDFRQRQFSKAHPATFFSCAVRIRISCGQPRRASSSPAGVPRRRALRFGCRSTGKKNAICGQTRRAPGTWVSPIRTPKHHRLGRNSGSTRRALILTPVHSEPSSRVRNALRRLECAQGAPRYASGRSRSGLRVVRPCSPPDSERAWSQG